MTVQTLTPTPFNVDGTGLNITALLAAPTQTTLQFANSGREVLLVAAASTAETVTVDVGALVDGQSVANFSAIALTNADTTAVGPFHSILDQSGTNEIQVVLSGTTNITVALVQMPGVY